MRLPSMARSHWFYGCLPSRLSFPWVSDLHPVWPVASVLDCPLSPYPPRSWSLRRLRLLLLLSSNKYNFIMQKAVFLVALLKGLSSACPVFTV